jgi:copper(I)-binding protein
MNRGGHTVTRWTRRLLAGAIAILVPALAGCEAGYNAPTLTFHPASSGVSTIVNGIAIDDLFVLGPALNSTLPAGGQAGVFLTLQAQNNDKLLSASAPGAASSVQLITGPIPLSPGTPVDLSGPHPLVVLNGLTSPLSGGETVQLTLDFANAGPVRLMVPVLPAAYDFATYFPPPTPSASTAAHRHKAKAKVKVAADVSAPAPASASPTAAP